MPIIKKPLPKPPATVNAAEIWRRRNAVAPKNRRPPAVPAVPKAT